MTEIPSVAIDLTELREPLVDPQSRSTTDLLTRFGDNPDPKALDRNGTIEAVAVFPIWNDERVIPSRTYEANVIQALGPYLQAQRDLGIVAPV